jgi:hypothetical protein
MDEVTAQARPTAGDLDRIQAALADTIDHTRNLLGADLSRLREIQEAERGQAHSRHDDLERQLDQIARRIEATLDGTWARMAQDGKWVDPVGQPQPAWPPPTGPPRYDYGLIAALEALIAESEPGWHQLYSELGLTPYDKASRQPPLKQSRKLRRGGHRRYLYVAGGPEPTSWCARLTEAKPAQ